MYLHHYHISNTFGDMHSNMGAKEKIFLNPIFYLFSMYSHLIWSTGVDQMFPKIISCKSSLQLE